MAAELNMLCDPQARGICKCFLAKERCISLFYLVFVLRKIIVNRYVRCRNLTSFRNQLEKHGFNQLKTSRNRGHYFHELFWRGSADALLSDAHKEEIK